MQCLPNYQNAIACYEHLKHHIRCNIRCWATTDVLLFATQVPKPNGKKEFRSAVFVWPVKCFLETQWTFWENKTEGVRMSIMLTCAKLCFWLSFSKIQ